MGLRALLDAPVVLLQAVGEIATMPVPHPGPQGVAGGPGIGIVPVGGHPHRTSAHRVTSSRARGKSRRGPAGWACSAGASGPPAGPPAGRTASPPPCPGSRCRLVLEHLADSDPGYRRGARTGPGPPPARAGGRAGGPTRQQRSFTRPAGASPGHQQPRHPVLPRRLRRQEEHGRPVLGPRAGHRCDLGVSR
jgi:hypothetical protein